MKRIFTIVIVAGFLPSSMAAERHVIDGTADARSKPVFSSGVVTKNTPGHAVQVDVDVRGASSIYLVATDAGDGIACDFANWAQARFITRHGNVDLRELPWVSVRTSWGEVRIDANAEGQPMRIGGKRVRGVGAHANSVIAYRVPEGATRFQALAGLDSQGTDEGCGSTVEFFVYTEQPDIDIKRLGGEGTDDDSDVDEEKLAPVREFAAGGFFGAGHDRTNFATPAETFRLQHGFRAELVYTVPLDEQGSWVCLAVDPQGRLVASDQQSGLYRITLPMLREHGSHTETKDAEDGRVVAAAPPVEVERLDVEIGGAQGLLFAHDSLYAVVHGEQTGFYRLQDTDGDDQFDKVSLLRGFDGGGEHGPHAVVLGPDKTSLFLVGGNSCFLSEPPEKSRVPQVWREDRLLTRTTATDGPWDEGNRIGGWVCRTDPEGREFELFAMGFRNPYDLAFNRDGELITFDADMEWDVGTPWYRPTRINHVVSGGDYGWRAGSAKWPDYFFDSCGSVVDVGLSSPTGLTFGYGARFPERFQNALFAADWSLGNIYAVHLSVDGASYSGEFEPFVTGAPLPVTDVVIHPHDGAMYFIVGGRGITSALYRITYMNQNSLSQPVPPASGPSATARDAYHTTRKKLEQYHAPEAARSIDDVWPCLSHSDRAIRYAARVALEHFGPDRWRNALASEGNPRTIIAASMALARHGDESAAQTIVAALGRVRWDALGREDRIDLLRTYAVLLSRRGRDGPRASQLRKQVRQRIDGHFPSGDSRLDQQLAELVVFVNAHAALGRVLDRLENASTQEEQIHYAMCLRDVERGWSLAQRRRFFAWFQTTAAQRGGVLFNEYLEQVRTVVETRLTDHERTLLDDVLKRPAQTDPSAHLAARQLVQHWQLDDLLDTISDGQGRVDRGREVFATAMCFRCHRFGGLGGMVGPDLTSVGRRFNVRDILEAITEPSKVISDQYRAVQIITDEGLVFTGKITDINGNTLLVVNDPLNPADISMVRRDTIEAMTWSPTSTMPTDLLDTFSKQEITDLLAFLRSGVP